MHTLELTETYKSFVNNSKRLSNLNIAQMNTEQSLETNTGIIHELQEIKDE